MNADRYSDRLARATAAAAGAGYAALAIGPSPDLRYLTGYNPMPLERPTLLLLRPDADPRMLVPELEMPAAASSPVGDRIELVGWADGDDPFAVVSGLLTPTGRVAVGDRMWASHLLGLQGALPAAAFAPASPVLGRLRAVKDPDELAALRAAALAADETFAGIVEGPFVGRTEADIAADLGRRLVDAGHATADFAIVASGPNAASPHHEPGERVISPGDAVVMDFGGELDGYFSDTSRTVVVARPPEGFLEVYEVVRAAQSAAIGAVRPGVPAEAVDRAARDVIRDAGYGERFVHRTGHGIGLEVHETPYLVRGNLQPLEEGMTFSVEPGIYLEGAFGVRIEDIVVVTASGADSLNRSSRELHVVG